MERQNNISSKCRHCETERYIKSRGLCWPCWSNPEIVRLYPAMKSRSADVQAGSDRLPTHPTSAPAGSLEKMKVMRKRLERGETLHHPSDNKDVAPAWMLNPNYDMFKTWRTGMPTGLEDDLDPDPSAPALGARGLL